MNGKVNTSRILPLTLTIAAVLAALAPASAAASKQVVNFFGNAGTFGGQFTDSAGVAVNNSGAGGVPVGTIYVTDGGGFDKGAVRGNRVERFQLDDNGTPADPSDDTYNFVSAWGAGVQNGGTSYEICTLAASCRAATGIGGNGTLAGDGSLSKPSGIAVDQDTGDVYVVDASDRRTSDDNFRINVYSATGAFLRSFGWDVVESGPDDNGTGYEVCKAGLDICKAGLPGSGIGQIAPLFSSGERVAEAIAISPPDGNPANGTVFLADQGNHRVNTYNLDGTNPSTFGASTFSSAFPPYPTQIAVDSRGIVYANDSTGGSEIVERYDTLNADGGGIGFLAPIAAPPLASGETTALAVDPGPGPGTDALYVARNSTGIQQFGPLNPPGLTAPPSAADDTHATAPTIVSGGARGIAVDQATGQIYTAGSLLSSGFAGNGVYVLGATNPTPPAATLDSLGEQTAHSITVHATVNPNGFPDSSYYLEYSTDGTTWKSTPPVLVGHQSSPQAIEAVLEPPPLGLLPNTLYHVRLQVQRRFAAPILATPSELTATTLPEKPSVETVGSPLRSATTARLDSRLDPNGSATTYHFEYGDEGPCESNPCESTADHPAGSGQLTELVSQQLGELHPATTYHYRIVADNGAPGPPAAGEDMTVTTRASDTPLSHGHFPGPPGSDRAWELVSAPDSSGNAVGSGVAFSNDGDRAIYTIAGGLSQGETGNLATPFFAQRPSSAHPTSGWQTTYTYPPRSELPGAGWTSPLGSDDLSTVFALNTGAFFEDAGPHALFRVSLGAPPTLLVEGPKWFLASNDGSRVVASLGGAPDSAYPTATEPNYYDVSSGAPRLLGLLPGGAVPVCGARGSSGFFESQPNGTLANFSPNHAQRWLSPDGSLLIFPSQGDSCSGSSQLYVREIEAEETVRISPPALSGPECPAALIKSTPSAVFFWTQSRLASEDTAISGACAIGYSEISDPGRNIGGDIYRYDLSGGGLECVTCVAPGIAADVEVDQHAPLSTMVVAADGSRVYFTSPHQLLAGAAAEGIYRIDVATGNLAYVAPGHNDAIGEEPIFGNAATPDGSVIVFQSDDPALNSLTGSDNGGTLQDYLYDDRDRSLACASCPQNGGVPTAPVQQGHLVGTLAEGPNLTPLSDSGDFAFSTPTPLVAADQNTAGPGQFSNAGSDVYEWRDGRQLLVSDGLTTSGSLGPAVQGVSPSGRDVFFTQFAQYAPDALDAINRLYDARIGGGINFPAAAKPCPLEVCQGTPKGAPEEAEPGTSSFSGPGNLKEGSAIKPRCAKGKVRRKGRCVAKKHKRAKRVHRAAKHNRRAAR